MKWDLTGTWRIIHVIYEFVIRYCCAYFSCFEALSLTNSRFLPSSRRYSPGWALASSTTSLHCSLSFVFSIHCLIFITFKPATTSSIYLARGLPLLRPINSLPSIIFLGIAPTSILSTCPSHLILWAFMNFTICSLFMDLFNSSLFLILQISPSWSGP